MSTAYHRDNCRCFFPLISGSTLPWSKLKGGRKREWLAGKAKCSLLGELWSHWHISLSWSCSTAFAAYKYKFSTCLIPTVGTNNSHENQDAESQDAALSLLCSSPRVLTVCVTALPRSKYCLAGRLALPASPL